MDEQSMAYGIIELMIMPVELVEEGRAIEFESQGIAVVGHTIVGSALDVAMQSEHLGDVLDGVRDKFAQWYVAPGKTWWEEPICRVVLAMEVVFEKTYCWDAGVYEYDQGVNILGLVDMDEVAKTLLKCASK